MLLEGFSYQLLLAFMEPKYRIALISDHASPLAICGGVDAGGQNIAVAELAQHLADLGYSIDIFTRWADEKLPQVIQWQPQIRVVHVKAGPKTFLPKEDFLPYMPEFTAEVLRFSKREGHPYRLVHAHFFLSAMVAADLKKMLGIPFVITFHALGKVRRLIQGDSDKFPALRFDLEDWVIREADQVIALCPQDRDDLLTLYNADPNKLTIIPNGFNPGEFFITDQKRARAKVGLPADEKIILQLGRMVPRKGVATVIEALARLKKQYGQQARLVIVGGESDVPDPVITPEIGRLQQLAETEGIADLVTFVGRKDRALLRYYYSASDVFVTTPWYEPFGITPLEAMASGAPVIGANVGGIQYTITDGETGLLVPPKDPEALAEKLNEVLSDKILATSLKEKALQNVHAQFTWEKVARQTAQLYEQYALPTFRPYRRSQKAIFLDKDGTLIPDIPYNVDPRKIRLYPDAGEALARLQRAGYQIFVVSNQSGVAKGFFQEEALTGVESRIRELLLPWGVQLSGFYYCPHSPQGSVPSYAIDCTCRKPFPGMILEAAQQHGIHLSESWMVGDILNDIEAGRRAGCRTVLINNGNETEWVPGEFRTPTHTVQSLQEMADTILNPVVIPVAPRLLQRPIQA